MRTVQGQIEQYVQSGAPVPPEAAVAARNISEPGLLADMVAYSPDMTTEQRQELLETLDVVERLRIVSTFLARQVEIRRAQGAHPVGGQVGAGQEPARVHPARAAQGHPARAGRGRPAAGGGRRAAREGGGLRHAGGGQGAGAQGSRPHEPHPHRVAGVGVIRTYVDWLVSLPWNTSTQDNLDIKQAAIVLDEDHSGLEKVKERILEYLAVRSLADTIRTVISVRVGYLRPIPFRARRRSWAEPGKNRPPADASGEVLGWVGPPSPKSPSAQGRSLPPSGPEPPLGPRTPRPTATSRTRKRTTRYPTPLNRLF